jgi:general secretion pathway protein B
MTGPAPTDLKVTGIAWQDERSARRAVVNGALIGEGAVASGARVVEIRQDQVRFSRDGQIVAAPITSSNR